ncbi:excinuclease ABC subunit UvrC [Marinagarivorans algicola]|uniref:excinuclease ABC subunit UvrC n=1 Tax=Marinagarivorans algicola TaxID=1513270 RepID=UPI0006B65ED3|nr:excinuclease ABC subunit UvrC [Marinagarivorans algicola]
MSNPFDVKAFLKNLTTAPGVYQMFDVAGKILYVGKAKNLKNRVSSYFHKAEGLTPKTQALVKRIANIEITVAPSEAEALVLEQNLIKAQRPPYNILMRDDKSYPYIFLSDTDEYPRIGVHRGAKKRKGKYYGPFPNASAVRESLSFLQKTFRVRQCEDSVFKNRTRPCLQYQIGRCTGPCVEAISKRNYREDVRHTQLFLEGRSELLHNELVQSMERASHNLAFEEAALHRDQITALRSVQAQNTVDAGQGSADIVACSTEAGQVCMHVLFVRDGRMLGSKSYFLHNKLDESHGELIAEFLPQLYLGGRKMDVPTEVVISHRIEETGVLAQVIGDVCGHKVIINHSVRTHRARWVAMAIEAATQNLRNRLGQQQHTLARFESLQQALNLPEVPSWIECFDISHSSGEATKASCVVFNREGAVKSRYRIFNIEGITAGDDYAAMEQALTRRYSRLQKEGADLPDLLLIDGGKGQLSKAREVMIELGITSMVLFGVAKGTTRKPGFETLIAQDNTEQVLSSDNPALHLIQQIRDEAHRFAITGHKAARDKKRSRSTLEDIPKVGPKRRRDMLKHFGGLQEITKASVADLAKVEGISRNLAEEIYAHLH